MISTIHVFKKIQVEKSEVGGSALHVEITLEATLFLILVIHHILYL